MAPFLQPLHSGEQQLEANEDAICFTKRVDTSQNVTDFSWSVTPEGPLYDPVWTDGKTSDIATFTMAIHSTPAREISDQAYFSQVPHPSMIRDISVSDLAPGLTDGCQWDTALDEGIGLSPMPLIEADPSKSLLALPSSDITVPWTDSYIDVLGPDILDFGSAISDQLTSNLNQFPTPTSPPMHSIASRPAAGSDNGFDIDIQRWHATQSRSRAADRFFVYGVLTTKIYCRPSCPSRRPSRRYVRFFPFPGAIETAEGAGFRPCKRCIPNALGVKNTAVLGVCEVLRVIIVATFDKSNTDAKESMKLESLARSAGLSTFHFHRLFKATTQITPGDFIHACRSLALQDALSKDQAQDLDNIVDAMALVKESQYSSVRSARKALGGITPTEYANGATTREVHYCCTDTPSGTMCVLYSPGRGDDEIKVLAVLLGDDAEARACVRFPAAAASSHHADRVARHIAELEEEGRDRDTELTADILSVLRRARVWLSLVKYYGK